MFTGLGIAADFMFDGGGAEIWESDPTCFSNKQSLHFNTKGGLKSLLAKFIVTCEINILNIYNFYMEEFNYIIL